MSEKAPELPPMPRYLQLMWGHEPSGRRGPRPTRTIHEIGAAAVALADREGLDAVSMKAVAAELGLTTMSLYRYVDSKDELTSVMIDLAYGDPDLAAVERGPWRRRVEAWARGVSAACQRHPWSADVTFNGPPITPNALGWMDSGLRALAPTGLTEQQKLSSLLALDGYVRNFFRTSRQLGVMPDADPEAGEAARTYGRRLAELVDPERFPALAGAQADFEDDDADFYETELAFGITLFLDGVEALDQRAGSADASDRRTSGAGSRTSREAGR